MNGAAGNKTAPPLLASRRGLALLALGLLGSFLIFSGAITWLHPLPPRSLVLATGPKGSSFAVFGERYQKLLAAQGIKVELVATAGGVENLALLQKPGSAVQAAFVDEGLAPDTDGRGLASLGSVCYQPLWFFSRRAMDDRRLFASRGLRLAVGPEGSDSRAFLQVLVKRKALEEKSFRLVELEPEQAAEALRQGRVDLALLVNSYASKLVRDLAKAEGVEIVDFRRAEAIAARLPWLAKRGFPVGAADLDSNKPGRDLTLLASKSSLLVRQDLHPALAFQLLEAMAQVHNRAGIFQKPGEFPAGEVVELPLLREAKHYYKSGQPILQRYLPFWLAALAQQLLIIFVPVIGLSYPVLRGLWALYGWGMQRRIFLIYGELYWLEERLRQRGRGPLPPELAEQLEELERRTDRVRVPAKFMPLLYSLKQSLVAVKAQLQARPRRKPRA